MPLLFLLLVISSSAPVQASDSNQAFVGCLNRLPDGTLQLGMLPSGKVYSIEGNTEPLFDHVNQLVRVLGRAEPNGDRISKLTVSSVQVVSDTCTAGLAAAKAQTVVGKVGANQVAIPVTTSASSDETTPGFQTEAGMLQLSGHNGHRSARPVHPATPYAPFEPEQVAQSESAANVNAEAAARAEILPGKTLGAQPTAESVPAVTGATAAPASTSAPPAKAAVAKPAAALGKPATVVGMTGDLLVFKPATVTIKVGQTVEWKNSSREVHTVTANPSKAANAQDVAVPKGAQPFDSGFLNPGQNYRHTFTTPGTYRYVCTLHEVQHMVGKVIVKP